MDIQSIRPAAVPSVTPLGRPEADPTRQTVRTELPQQSVAAMPRADTSQTAHEHNAFSRQKAQMDRITDQMRENLERRVEYDDGAGEWVYRSIDPRTKQTVKQFPDDMIMRLKAYRREQEAAASRHHESAMEKRA